MIGTHQRTIPDGWTVKRWVNELERRATIAARFPKVAATMRRWAAELREEHGITPKTPDQDG